MDDRLYRHMEEQANRPPRCVEVLINGVWHRYNERKASAGEGQETKPSTVSPTTFLGKGNFPIRLNGIEQSFDENDKEYHYWVKQEG